MVCVFDETAEERETKSSDDDVSFLPSTLFMELASEARFSILVSINNKPAKLSTIARQTDTTVQEVSRNLNRLIEEGLVGKHNRRTFSYYTIWNNDTPSSTLLYFHKKI